MTRSGWKTVWITGASSGIGLELAKVTERHAQHVAVSARSSEKLQILASQHSGISSFPVDVTDKDAVCRIVKSVEENAGPIDLAVLNAGAWTLMEMQDFDLSAVRKGVEVNYMGVMNALDVLIPRMLERRGGHIAIVASVAGYRGLPRSVAYGPTKAALINLAETLKLELEPHGIAVSLINPGFVKTPMTQDNPFPMPGIMNAEDAAQQILTGLRDKKFEIAFPRAFVLTMKLLKVVPNKLYFWFVRKFVVRGNA